MQYLDHDINIFIYQPLSLVINNKLNYINNKYTLCYKVVKNTGSDRGFY